MCNPVAAVIAAATAVTANEQRRSRNAANDAAASQQRMLQEQENTRIAEAQAEAERLRKAEESRQQNIGLGQSEIASAFGQFDDGFYNTRQQSYMDYALPQLDTQYQDAIRGLTASLARSGNLNSSLRGEQMANLQSQYDQQKLSIADQARSYGDQARSAVEQARARLMESNANLADPGQIRTQAAAEASGISANPTYQSLGQLLSGISADVTSAGGVAKKTGSGTGVQLYNSGLSGSGRVVS
jgi:hypothetical protein